MPKHDDPEPIQRPPAEPFDVVGLRTFPLASRPSKVAIADVGRPLPPGAPFDAFLDSLPNQLAARSLRRLCGHMVRVQQEGRMCVCALGGHVIKTGCAPYLIDLMDRGVIKAIALNGAAAIHDLELALAGKTSEDVGPRLLDGSFGMAAEPALVFAEAARAAAARQLGLGWALGGLLDRRGCLHAGTSLLVAAYRRHLPCTVHVALGADVVHMHPAASGADLGAATMLDFRILTTVVSKLAHGLWLNVGCAVILPEVFLKAVAIVRNFGGTLDGLATANLDMVQQYRGRVNVCERPGDEGIQITGHHEIMIPLLSGIVAAQLAGQPPGAVSSEPWNTEEAA